MMYESRMPLLLVLDIDCSNPETFCGESRPKLKAVEEPACETERAVEYG